MRLRLFVAEEYQPLRVVPWWLWLVIMLSLSGQIAFQYRFLPAPTAETLHLDNPPPEKLLRLLAFGDHATLARLMALYLQSADNQKGASISFKDLDYRLLGLWLDRIVALDEKAEYPHFMMSKVYSNVFDISRRYQAADWVEQQFLRDPVGRWEWMAYVTNLINYVIKDTDSAMRMAQLIREKTSPGQIPGWARQMEVFFLENEDEFEAAADMLEGQLVAGEVTEPQEFMFLSDRLDDMLRDLYNQSKITPLELRKRIERLNKLRAMYLKQYDDE